MTEEIHCPKLNTLMSDSICKEKKGADCGDCPNKKSGRGRSKKVEPEKPEAKICKKCQVPKDPVDFYSGDSTCKKCRGEESKARHKRDLTGMDLGKKEPRIRVQIASARMKEANTPEPVQEEYVALQGTDDARERIPAPPSLETPKVRRLRVQIGGEWIDLCGECAKRYLRI